MYCNNCGAKLGSKDSFCSSCGKETKLTQVLYDESKENIQSIKEETYIENSTNVLCPFCRSNNIKRNTGGWTGYMLLLGIGIWFIIFSRPYSFLEIPVLKPIYYGIALLSVAIGLIIDIRYYILENYKNVWVFNCKNCNNAFRVTSKTRTKTSESFDDHTNGMDFPIKRVNLILLIVLSVCTGGVYMAYWIISRASSLKKLREGIPRSHLGLQELF